MKVEIWSDVVCPWCYIGKRRFERALSGFAHREQVEVVYRSYQLDPSAVVGSTQSSVEHLGAKLGASRAQVETMMAGVERTAAAEGLEYHLADGVTGNTALAHQLLHLAAARGLADVAWERLYRAHFSENRSVFDVEALVALGVEIGLSADEVHSALADESLADVVRADAREAAALGATGVPFFVVDRAYGIAGAQPSEVFSQVLEQAWAAAHPLTMVGPASDESCADGTCAV